MVYWLWDEWQTYIVVAPRIKRCLKKCLKIIDQYLYFLSSQQIRKGYASRLSKFITKYNILTETQHGKIYKHTHN